VKFLLESIDLTALSLLTGFFKRLLTESFAVVLEFARLPKQSFTVFDAEAIDISSLQSLARLQRFISKIEHVDEFV
jgi:hypothetical protein